MANPYLPTEQAVAQSSPEILGLERQRKLADLLTAQAFTQPQGQMISGHYVAPSWTQQLAPLASALAGGAISERADKKQEELATALRGKKAVENKAINEAITEKDWNKAAQLISASETGAGKEYLPLIAKYLVPEQMKPQVVSPGGALVDANGKLIYQAPFKPTGGAGGEGIGVMGSNMNNNGVRIGTYDKMGRYRSPTGQVYTAKAMDEARAEHDQATDLAYKLNQLTKSDIKNAYGSAFDYSGSKLGQMVGSKNVVDAQTKINSLQIGSVLENLSKLKGASSDKEMKQMIRDFPGYNADPSVMENWVERAAATTNRFLKRSEGRFGFDTDYAEQGRFGEKPKDEKSTSSNAPLEFKNEADAAKAGLKKGTRVVINGVAGTWE